jgi:hypothetical protein
VGLGPGGGKGCGRAIRPRESENPVAGADQLADDGGADKSCRSGEEDTHDEAFR